MIKSDFQKFSDLWSVAYERAAGNKQLSKTAISFDFDLLSDFDLQDIEGAIKQHCRNNKFAPTVHDIIEILIPDKKYLSADEAWALCPYDENDTIRWTEITASAFSAASEERARGSEMSARMIFKGSYSRLCDEYKKRRKEDRWVISYGNDPSRRVQAIDKFVQLGYMTQEEAIKREPSACFAFSRLNKQLENKSHACSKIHDIAKLISSPDQKNRSHPLDNLNKKSKKERKKILDEYQCEFENKRQDALKQINAFSELDP